MPAARLTLLAALFAAAPLAFGQTTVTVSTATTTTATGQPAAATTPESKLTAQFTELAGSKENAAALVSGLRTGSAITLTSPPPSGTSGTPVGTATTFTAPTKPMGYGNVRIALSLAKSQLASQGISNPTPEQLQGALVGTQGGSGTTAQSGILQMRADGMGWGKIANTMGVKLGAVMSGKQTWPTAGTTSTTTASGVTTAAGGVGKSSGVTTAAGNGGGKHSGITTAGGGGHSHSGITTGMGQSHSGGYAYGQAARGGAVTAAGGHAGSMAGGGGHGGGKH